MKTCFSLFGRNGDLFAMKDDLPILLKSAVPSFLFLGSALASLYLLVNQGILGSHSTQLSFDRELVLLSA